MAAVVFGIVVSVLIAFFVLKSNKKSKANIIRTLPRNEVKIVKLLLEHKAGAKGIKRSKLEKLSGLAKSSLSAALNNLEKKNIIVIDKSYATHFIKFTEWFKKL